MRAGGTTARFEKKWFGGQIVTRSVLFSS